MKSVLTLFTVLTVNLDFVHSVCSILCKAINMLPIPRLCSEYNNNDMVFLI